MRVSDNGLIGATATLVERARGLVGRVSREKTFPPSGVSTATVREFQVLAERFPDWDLADGDVKSFQRPWMVAMVLDLVPRGGKILEYGAGDCAVAGRLSALGYDVWVVDPYDGSGGGPADWAPYARRHPKITFIPERLDPVLDLPRDFDATCSVSVLEHIPREAQRAVASAIEIFSSRGGYNLEAVDFTVRGRILLDYPLVDEILRVRGIRPCAARLAHHALSHVDTYYLSPAMHRRWRKSRSFDDYPYRQVTSLNIVRPL